MFSRKGDFRLLRLFRGKPEFFGAFPGLPAKLVDVVAQRGTVACPPVRGDAGGDGFAQRGSQSCK
ncbi:hypothetical protein [uncultured Bilophila sp.]|uniref:hypothetical protein n=1 Tax=uncultured Bilophila sp. TaxID=529385 RepID=UPI0026292FC1|nr:hypothetical protein [uncultured Bilophila sp.]